MVNEYGLSLHNDDVTPGGLIKRQNIRRFTAKLFNNENEHNPFVARVCKKCTGKGFYRMYDPPLGDVSCEECNRVGAFEELEPFFSNNQNAEYVEPNNSGSVKCPNCGKTFPIYSNQYWTGLRHTCGQKIILKGEFSGMCWTREK